MLRRDAGQNLQERVGEPSLDARARFRALASRARAAAETGRFRRSLRPRASRGGAPSAAGCGVSPPSSARRPSPKRRIVSALFQGAGASVIEAPRPTSTRSYQQPSRSAFRRLVAGDDEPLRRAGHRDIEQAPVFARLGLAPLGPRARDGFAVLRRLPAPGEERRVARVGGREAQELRVVSAVGRAAGVGQEDDRAPRAPCWRGRSARGRRRSRLPCRA